VLLLTIVGAVLIGSFVASQWAHLPALPTAGGGEVGEITTAYKTYTQTLYVMDKDDLFDAFDKAADGNVGAHNGAGKDFSATFTSPPIAIHKGDQVRKLVTKHTYNFPKDYSKLEKMEHAKGDESKNIRAILHSVDKAIKEHKTECDGDNACANKPFQVVIRKVHRIYYHPSPVGGLVSQLKNKHLGRPGRLYIRIADDVSEVTPRILNDIKDEIAVQMGIQSKDLICTIRSGSVVLDVLIQSHKFDGHELAVAFKHAFKDNVRKCADGDKKHCKMLLVDGIRELQVTTAKPHAQTFPPGHEKAGQHTGGWMHKHFTKEEFHKELMKDIHQMTYPPHHHKAGKGLSKDDLHKELMKQLGLVGKGLTSEEEKLRKELLEKFGKMKIGASSEETKHLIDGEGKSVLKHMTKAEREEHRRLISHEKRMLSKLSKEEKEELVDMQKKWDSMSKEQQEALMSRWSRKMHEDEVKTRMATENVLSKEDAEHQKSWDKMTEEEKKSTRALIRRLMSRASREMDEHENFILGNLKNSMQQAQGTEVAQGAGSPSVIVLTYPPHHEKAGQVSGYHVRAEERRVKDMEDAEQRRLRHDERRSRRAEQKNMKWMMHTMQKAMSKEQRDAMKNMETNEGKMEKNFLTHMGKMYRSYRAKMTGQNKVTTNEEKKMMEAMQRMAKHPIILTYPPHHHLSGQALPPHLQPASAPCTVGTPPCGVPAAPVQPPPCAGIQTPTGCAAIPAPCQGLATATGCMPAAAMPAAGAVGCASKAGLSAAVCELQGKVNHIWQKAQPLLKTGPHGLAGG